MRAPHLERLIDYVGGGGSLDSHEGIPSDIHRDLVLESQIGRKSKKTPRTLSPPLSILHISVLHCRNFS
jgi:hypothetical protein